MRTVAIIQARMGSSRLPGKVMRMLAGRPMIDHVVDRARRIADVDQVVVATPDTPADDELVAHLLSVGVELIRGPTDDVLRRYRLAAEQSAADAVVRITADCPLLSPAASGTVVETYRSAYPAYDYVSNSLLQTYPRGVDTEIFSLDVLRVADEEATDAPDREHVTSFVYRRPNRFRLKNVAADQDRHELRLTVDTDADLELVGRIYQVLYPRDPRFELADVLALLDAHPDWAELNRHVIQKAYGQ